MRAAIVVSALTAAILPAEQTATADDAQRERQRIEQLEADARAAKDLEKHAEAGTAYLQLYTGNSKQPDGDQLLYNAGLAFEDGRALSAAIEAFTRLERDYPWSKLRPL